MKSTHGGIVAYICATHLIKEAAILFLHFSSHYVTMCYDLLQVLSGIKDYEIGKTSYTVA